MSKSATIRFDRLVAPGRSMVLALLVMLGLVGGCMRQWRPLEPVTTTPSVDTRPALADCINANRRGIWIYEERELTGGDDAPTATYVRQVTANRITEGYLWNRSFRPLDDYLQLDDATTSRPADDTRPAAPIEGGTVIFFRLTEPADPIPLELESTPIIASTTPIRYFNYRGQPSSMGTLERCVSVETFEDVDCPAGHFPQCARLRIDLKVHFPWVAVVNLTTHLWLSPEVGEVRRVQQFSGWFLIFWFGRTDEYRLVSHLSAPDATGTVAPPRWSTAALLLTGAYPRPKIAGMAIDLAVPEPETRP